MTRTSKLPRYAEFNGLANCFGEWTKNPKSLDQYLDFSQEITMEVGAGKAGLSLELARNNPDKTYIAIDKKSDRLWRPAKTALDEGITNIAFLQSDARLLKDFGMLNKVHDIWVTFPDPYPKKGQAKNRLVHKNFLDIYKELLSPDGFCHLKTDDKKFFDYLHEVIEEFKGAKIVEQNTDVSADIDHPALKIQTDYEKRWRAEGRTIYYAKFTLA